MDTYSTTLSSGVLAVMALGSLPFTPFTEQYANASRPLQDWEKPLFRQTNRVLTLMWALVFGLIAVLGYVRHRRCPQTKDWTNWVIPIVVHRRCGGHDAGLSGRGCGQRARPAG